MHPLLIGGNLCLIVDAFVNMITALLAPFAIISVYHGETKDLGLLLAIFAAFQALAMMIFGKLADHIMPVHLLILLAAAKVIFMILAGLASTVAHASIIFAMLGFLSSSTPVMRTLVASLIHDQMELTMQFGLNGLMSQIGSLLAIFAIGLCDSLTIPYGVMFMIGAAPGFITALVFSVILRQATEDERFSQPRAVSTAGTKVKGPLGSAVWLQMGCFALFHFATSATTSVLSLTYQTQLHFKLRDVSIVVFFQFIFLALSTLLVLKPMTIGLGNRLSVVVASGLLAVYSVGMTLISEPLSGIRGLPLVVVIQIICAIGMTVFVANVFTILAVLLPKEDAGFFMGLNSTFGALGRALGPASGVYLFVRAEWWVPYLFSGCGYSALAFIYLLGVKHDDGSPGELM